MLMVSTGYSTAILGPQSFAEIFNGGTLHVYAGTRPVSANAQASEAMRLASIVRIGMDGGLMFAQAGPYILIPPGDWWQLLATNAGLAAWFRLMTATDTGVANFTDARIDGDIGSPAAPAELVLQTSALAAGTAVPIDSFLFTIPPA